jgi:hypothetical protein
METLSEEILSNKPEKLTISQLWDNQPPVIHWCLGLTCVSFSFVYVLLFTML